MLLRVVKVKTVLFVTIDYLIMGLCCVCNGCNDLTMLSLNISDIVVITAKRTDHHCIFHDIGKCEAIYL